MVAVYCGFGRTHLMFERNKHAIPHKTMPLPMQWYCNPNILRMDAYVGEEKAPAVYSFLSAPGLYGLIINSIQKPQVEPKNYQITRENGGLWTILFDIKFD